MTTSNNPIVFKVEDSLWQMYQDGRKTWDARLWNTVADERCYRLSWYRTLQPVGQGRVPIEPQVSFANKATGEVITFEYLGVEFAPWAPGWGFIQLGRRLGEVVRP